MPKLKDQLHSLGKLIRHKKRLKFFEPFFMNILKLNYASIFAYLAFFSINSLRGGTSSPINIENT